LILRDPVHGLVSFESAEQAIVPALLEAREVQRLRRIRQLGLTSLAYPGADHTRFSHAIGAAHVMTRLLARLRSLHEDLPYWQRVTSERGREALSAALLHDLGHGPFSHLFEEALPSGPHHETWTERMILDPGTEVHQILARNDPGLPQRVVELIRGRSSLTYLARAVSGTFDVDRCDYLLRDAYSTGVGYGSFDLDWLIRSFRFGVESKPGSAPPLAIDGAKGLPAIESFILARLFMFQQVYFHKTSRASEWMVTQVFARVRDLLLNGTDVEGVPTAVKNIALHGDASLGEYLDLDDVRMLTCLSAWQSSSDSVLRDFATRLCQRKLFKTYELYAEQAEPNARLEAYEIAKDVARQAGYDPSIYVGLDVSSDVPFDDTHEPLTVVFPDNSQRRPADVSFLLGRLRGQKLMRVRLIFIPELRERIVTALMR
jgi:HD superfamily phosphohydrolase